MNFESDRKHQFFNDSVVFESAFKEYYIPLCLFADKYLNDMEASKDLVHDVFIDLWEKEIKVISSKSVKSFLYTVVRNNSINCLRKQKTQKDKFHQYCEEQLESLEKIVFDDEHDLKSTPVTDDEILEHDTIYKLSKSIEKLPPKSRETMKLAVMEYSNKEIASMMNVTVETVKTVKKRSYKFLRDVLTGVFV